MQPPRFSIVIPARDEERFIGGCLQAIRAAAAPDQGSVEIIVVLNRCSDRTGEIAQSFGARTIREDARNLAKIRNAGARAATGSVLLTIDADSRMSPGTLRAIDHALSRGKTVGGGTAIRPDRWSAGIFMTYCAFRMYSLITRISAGLFWCYRKDFEAIGGFNENLVSAEDVDFARRLKAHGKKLKRPFATLRGGHIITSCRKFDTYGDWCMVTDPGLILRLLAGNNQRAADAFYYDFER